MEKFVIIDGNSLINRAFYALPPLNNSKGISTQGVYGFTTMLIKAINEIKPDYLAVAFDLPKKTFRHEKYADYKANRKGMPDDLAIQMPLLKEMLSIMGITILEKPGYEADDIIGTMSKRAECQTFIITGDRDALQLIDENITVLLTKKGLSEIHAINESALLQDYKLRPCQVIDFKALSGDTSDNIPGVAGVGEKTAMTLLEAYGNIKNIYNHIDEITGKLKEKLIAGKESAEISHFLATINTDVDIDCDVKKCTYKFPFNKKIKLFFNDMAFKSLVKRDDIFEADDSQIIEKCRFKKPVTSLKVIGSISELKEVLGGDYKKIAVYIGESINFSISYSKEYAVNITYSLLDMGLNYNEVINELKPVLENEKIQKVLFDKKEMTKNPEINKIKIVNYFDVKLAQYICDMTVEYDTIFKLLQSYEIDEREPATGLLYICDELSIEIEKLNMHNLYYNIELPLVEILYDMEQHGFCVNVRKLNELGAEFSLAMKNLSEEIIEIAGQEFNINSPKQLAKVLFEDMKIPYPVKSKTYSTSAEILEQIEKENPIAKKVLSYRFYSKLNSTYVEGLKKLTDANGVVHTEFRQTLTTTGRLSSIEPNLQNIPIRTTEGRELRGAFVPSKDNVLISADYSQIELRLMAHLSGDEKMIQAYNNGEDIHTSTASEVFGVPVSEVTGAMRRDAKAVNFGIIYGISDFGLATNLGIAPYKAREYISKYFERFKGVKQYLDRSVKQAKEKGYAETIFGRIRKIPELYSSNYNMRQFGERVAMNMPLQGSAADIIKIAMIKVYNALKGMKSKLILQVHDELIIDADVNETEKVKQILIDNMPTAAQLKVPLSIEIGMGENWLLCK